MMPTIAVCLSGCGFKDGSEIHEAVLTLLALDQAGAKTLICAPDMDQPCVINHLTNKPAPGERRNVLVESARIARGKIVDLATIRAADVDGLILPGGYGAANNLCSFSGKGPDCDVHPEVERVILEMADAGKPIGAICISPTLVGRVLGKRMPVTLTIGSEAGVARAIERMGCRHEDCRPTEFVVDAEHRIVSTPAYMYGDSGPAKIYEGIHGLVKEVLRLASPAK
jgi:enhancing lycopene biosynthesis protein 2